MRGLHSLSCPQGLELHRGGSQSRLCVPAQGQETNTSNQEGKVAVLSSIKLEWAPDRLCGFSQNSLDWKLARILKSLYRAKRAGLIIREAGKGFPSLLFQMSACTQRPELVDSFPIAFQLVIIFFRFVINYYCV